MSSSQRLTTTSYAILGLLAVRSWSTYELTRQMEWSLGRFWPRAKSKLYEEPKKLERLGLATSRTESTGQAPRRFTRSRPRDVGRWRRGRPSRRRASRWRRSLCFAIFLADQGTRDDALATLAAARAWAEERNEGNLAAGRAFLAGGGEFDARAAPTMLVGAFLTDFYKLVADWADWAGEQVADWPDDPAAAEPDHDEQRAIVARAEWSEKR